ncbi:MAG: PTS sugar transporter subunit IIA [Spirochaetales bacterium]|nr:PTS sugar transporter subunit IIA [Spirochaetales bacterium]
MKLHTLLGPDDLVIIREPGPKNEMIESLLGILWKKTDLAGEGMPFDTILEELFNREKEQTTAIGGGFAFPHARLNGIQGSYFLIATSRQGIDFDSMDRQPVSFVIMSLVPRLKPGLLIKFRAAIISILMRPDMKEQFLAANTPKAMHALLEQENRELDQNITAVDIMNPLVSFISPDMTLYEAARELHRHHVDSLPVIDENRKLVGKLSCHDLFSYQLPDFFNTLHSISFIKFMNPFEKYFEADQTRKIGELKFKQKTPIIKPDSTLMEIIFEMTVHDQELVYVAEDDKLLGTIDRYSIIDKILISGIDGDSV